MGAPLPFRHAPGTVLGYRRDGRPILPIAGAEDPPEGDPPAGDPPGGDPATEALTTLSDLVRTAVREEIAAWDAARQPPKKEQKRPAPKKAPAPEPEKPPTILDQLAGLFRT